MNYINLAKKYRKKPAVIEAMRLSPYNLNEVAAWCGGYFSASEFIAQPDCVVIQTLEGAMNAYPGDWIIKGIKGEFYPCKDDIFRATYEETA